MTPSKIKERAWKIADSMCQTEVTAKAVQILVSLVHTDRAIHLIPDASVHEPYFLRGKELAKLYCLKEGEWLLCPGEICKHKSLPHFGPNHEGEF